MLVALRFEARVTAFTDRVNPSLEFMLENRRAAPRRGL